MTLSIVLSNMRSRAARAKVAANGVRRFAVGALQTEVSGDVVHKIWDGFARFAGSIVGGVVKVLFAGLKWSVSALVGILVSSFNFIWNFNWNTDFDDAKAQLNTGLTSLAGSLGTTVGNALGHLVCGGGTTALIMTFNEPLALYLFKELGEDALNDIASNLGNLIRQTANLLAASAFKYLYASAKHFLEWASDEVKKQLVDQGHITHEQIADTKKAKKEPWSFSSGYQKFVNDIPNQAIQNLLENTVEEFSDACINDGYIIGAGIDSYLAAAKIANGGILGTDQAVEILLNRAPQPEVS